MDAPDAEWPTLEALRLRYILQVLEHMGGNKTHAAGLLGIGRRTIHWILSRDPALGSGPPSKRGRPRRTPR
ncbi:MAG: helix-turn-helix domain-containing protein [Minicystis sp.]